MTDDTRMVRDLRGPLTGHDYPRSHMSSDAIVLLKNDHKEIRGVLRDFAEASENASTRKGQLVDRMIELLTVHTYIENEVMDPRVRALLPELEADVLVMELSGMKPGDERFDAKTTVLMENVEHHMDEERRTGSPRSVTASVARPSRRSAPRCRRRGRRPRPGRRNRARSRSPSTPSSADRGRP